MATKRSLVNTVLLVILIVVSFMAVSLGYFLVANEIKKFDVQSRQYQEEYVNFRKAMIKDEIDIVISYIEFKKNQLNRNADLSLEAVQNDILNWINQIRLRQNQYVVVNGFDGTILAHYKKKNIGKNMWDFTDANGIKPVQEAIKVSKHPEGGFIRYVGSIRPSTGKPGKKITYARSIPEWEWTVLTGIYMDDIENVIEQREEALKRNIRTNLIRISLILAVVFIISLVFAKFITERLRSNFAILESFFNKAAEKSETIDQDLINYSEFQDLAISVNQMTEERNLINEKLNKHQRHLESLVEQRTKALEETVHKLNIEIKERNLAQKDKEIKILQLQEALIEVKTLQGLLPICANCKKVRDDTGYWHQIETYIENRSDAVFSHGVCPDCMDNLYGDKAWYKKR
ncbi:MAG: hypothetical protein D3926_02120 [Desulfobacteraceae bacterium]|nr:MAG: hypothetical protein D3926_02120 [Desulfobacteraceae bacterium]